MVTPKRRLVRRLCPPCYVNDHGKCWAKWKTETTVFWCLCQTSSHAKYDPF